MIRILIGDDDLGIRDLPSALIKQLLKSAEFEVAGGGREALQKLNSRNFDVVITDIRMPGLDGFATTAGIRRMPPPQCHRKIICMAGGKIPAEMVQQCSIDGALQKPFNLNDLRRKLSEVIPSSLLNRMGE